MIFSICNIFIVPYKNILNEIWYCLAKILTKSMSDVCVICASAKGRHSDTYSQLYRHAEGVDNGYFFIILA
jgi:hypothetical protein